MEYAPADMYRRLRDFWLGDEALSVFLILLFLALFLGPFLDSPQVRLLTSLFFSLLMVSGVINLSRRPSIRFVAGIVACGIGSNMITKPLLEARDYKGIENNVRAVVELVKNVRAELAAK